MRNFLGKWVGCGMRKLSIAAVILAVPVASFAAASVWTMRNDNNRSSASLSEKQLNTSNVNTTTFGKLFTLPADDQVYTTPLYINDLNGINTVYFASTNNTVYAYNADTGAFLWSKNLNNGFRPFSKSDANAFGACGGGYNDAAGNMGIIGTPVIDVKTKTLYVVVKTVENGNYPQRLHALDLANNGASKFGGPVVIGGSAPGNADGGSTVTFKSRYANQRAGLALVNNVVYIAQASYCDSGPYHGWVMGFNAKTLAQVAAWTPAPNGTAAGIWQGGQPPAVDGAGNLIVATGNGFSDNSSDGNTNFGESVVKLSPNGSGNLSMATFWTPANWAALDAVDDDQGAAGLLILPGQSRILQGGKDSILHLIDANNMGGLGAGNIQQFQATFSQNGGSKHIHGAPIYWNSASNGGLLYVWGEDDYLRTFKYSPTTNISTSPFRTGTVLTPQIGYGMPGANLAISALGGQAGTGVVWANAVYDGDANQGTRPGILRAYDADNAVSELWNSRKVATDSCGYLAKGTHPVVANGKVFISSFGSANLTNSGQVCVYGLKAKPALPPGGLPNYPTNFAGASQFAFNGSAFLTEGNQTNSTNCYIGWSAATAYTAGATVSFGGVNYKANYWTQGQNPSSYNGGPGSGKPWTIVSTCTAPKPLCYAAWSSSTAYTAGATVSYNSVNYQANFWTQGQNPSTNNGGGGSGQPWVIVATCGPSAPSGSIRLTDGRPMEGASAFYLHKVDVTKFHANFSFKLTAGAGATIADGMTFTIQGASPYAIGGSGAGLGYGVNPGNSATGIPQSVAIKFDVYDNAGEGNNSTGIFINGVAPTTPMVTLPANIDLHSGRRFNVAMAYNGVTLTVTITDAVTAAAATQSYTVNIPAVVGSTGYVGFTGGTGSITTTQDVLNFTYTNP